jgi:hypothetical protein
MCPEVLDNKGLRLMENLAFKHRVPLTLQLSTPVHVISRILRSLLQTPCHNDDAQPGAEAGVQGAVTAMGDFRKGKKCEIYRTP